MSYLCYVPENPLFEGEHLTIVWMGPDTVKFGSTQEKDIMKYANSVCPFEAIVLHETFLEGKLVVMMSLPHEVHRVRAMHLEYLSRSHYPHWLPHMTQREELPMGHAILSRVIFTHAELR